MELYNKYDAEILVIVLSFIYFFVLYFTVLVEGYARFSHWGDLLQLSHHFWGSGVGRGEFIVSYLKMR